MGFMLNHFNSFSLFFYAFCAEFENAVLWQGCAISIINLFVHPGTANRYLSFLFLRTVGFLSCPIKKKIKCLPGKIPNRKAETL